MMEKKWQQKKTWFCVRSLFLSSFPVVMLLLLLPAGFASSPDNPADELVDVINKNRTAHKASKVEDKAGLGCMALQYIKAYQGDCGLVGPKGKKPPETSFAEIFGPNCGVEVSTLGQISGRLVGCETKYVSPAEAFSHVLVRNDESLDILYNKNHTQVGVGIQGSDGGSPYFWCVLFSSGDPETTFKVHGTQPPKQTVGCYSGTNDQCSQGSLSRIITPWQCSLICLGLTTLFLMYFPH